MSVDVAQKIFTKRMLVVLLTGFSSGLPLLLTGSTLQAWMTDEGVDLAVIGAFALVGLPYTLKFLWSPLMDRYIFASSIREKAKLDAFHTNFTSLINFKFGDGVTQGRVLLVVASTCSFSHFF